MAHKGDKPTELRPVGGLKPPQDLAAEAAVNSALLNKPAELDRVATIIPDPAAFYSHANRFIFEAIQSLADAGTEIDLVSVRGWLADHGRLEQVGGAPYLAKISDATPAIGNVDQHATIVREKWRLRRGIATCQRYAAEGYGEAANVQAYLDGAERDIAEIAQLTATNPVELVGTVMERRVGELREMRESGIVTIGIPTQLTHLDRKTGGMHRGDLYVLAGRPGLGKTALATTICLNVARPDRRGDDEVAGWAALFFSLEMQREQIATRFTCAEETIDASKVRNNRMDAEVWKSLEEAAAKIVKLPLYVDDTPAVTLRQIGARVRRLKREIELGSAPVACRGLGLVVVDYLQLATGLRVSGDSREREVASLSAGLKNLAKRENVPVLALSQLNRAVETKRGGNKRPVLSDLRESGAIEQDADHVWLLYRDDYYEEDSHTREAEIIIAKQRNGATGTVKTYWNEKPMRFDNLEDDSYYEDMAEEDV
jgi:replicative DNA helicase